MDETNIYQEESVNADNVMGENILESSARGVKRRVDSGLEQKMRNVAPCHTGDNAFQMNNTLSEIQLSMTQQIALQVFGGYAYSPDNQTQNALLSPLLMGLQHQAFAATHLLHAAIAAQQASLLQGTLEYSPTTPTYPQSSVPPQISPVKASLAPSQEISALQTEASNASVNDILQSLMDEFRRKEGEEKNCAGKDTIPQVDAINPASHAEKQMCQAVHQAAATDSSDIGYLLKNFPRASRMMMGEFSFPTRGEVPIHVAAKQGKIDAVKTLLEHDRKSAFIRDDHGCIALHAAADQGHFAVVQIICSVVPECAQVECDGGCLPLHYAVSTGAHQPDAPQITAILLATYPESVRVTTEEGLLPLHLAAMAGFPAGIRTIFAYNFSAVYDTEITEGMLPLDFAVDGLGMCEVSNVSEANNEGDSESPEGSIGIYAAYKGNSEEMLSIARPPKTNLSFSERKERYIACIEILLSSSFHHTQVPFPRHESSPAFLPLHAIILANPVERCFKTLIHVYQEFASSVDKSGQSPLHILINSYLEDEFKINMIKELNKLCLNAAHIHDEESFLPLHIALLKRSNYEVVEIILQCNKSAATVEVGNSCSLEWCRGMYPFQLAAASDCSEDVIDLLLSSFPVGVASALSLR